MPVSADELEHWLARQVHGLRVEAPQATVRLSRLTQGPPGADLEIGWLCMHHLLPSHGVAHERLTTQIAGWLQRELQPKGVGVVLEAEHLCMSLPGVQKLGAKTVTGAKAAATLREEGFDGRVEDGSVA